MVVLTDNANLNLKLHAKPEEQWEEESTKNGGNKQCSKTPKITYFVLKDKVMGIHHALEQIIAHQCNIESEDGVGFRIQGISHKQLEGFNFMDLASDASPCWPLVTTIKATGSDWADFVRAIHAITLFGRGFGDILQPSKPTELCSLWKSVSKNQDYLAVCCTDLETIFKKHGDRVSTPWRLNDDIHWVKKGKTFEHCKCKLTDLPTKQRCDRVQFFLPSRSVFTISNIQRGKLESPSFLATEGVIILGHSSKLPLRWGAHDNPEEGDLEYSDEEVSHPMEDSTVSPCLPTMTLQSSGNFPALNEIESGDDDPSPNDAGSYSIVPSSIDLRTANSNSSQSPNSLGPKTTIVSPTKSDPEFVPRKRKRAFIRDSITKFLRRE